MVRKFLDSMRTRWPCHHNWEDIDRHDSRVLRYIQKWYVIVGISRYALELIGISRTEWRGLMLWNLSTDFSVVLFGFYQGVGHPLRLLYDAKVPNYHNNKGFKDLGPCSEWPKVVDAVIKAPFRLVVCAHARMRACEYS